MAFKTFRFTFSDEVTQELYEFNRIHQYDDKKIYKESWETWRDAHQLLLEKETERLKQMGFEGDVLGKLYHSCRYYIRNQFVKAKSVKIAERKVRTIVPKSLLREIDEHIKNHSTEKPIEAYRHFQRTQQDRLEITQDLHKPYMNRYYVLKQKNKTLE